MCAPYTFTKSGEQQVCFLFLCWELNPGLHLSTIELHPQTGGCFWDAVRHSGPPLIRYCEAWAWTSSQWSTDQGRMIPSYVKQRSPLDLSRISKRAEGSCKIFWFSHKPQGVRKGSLVEGTDIALQGQIKSLMCLPRAQVAEHSRWGLPTSFSLQLPFFPLPFCLVLHNTALGFGVLHLSTGNLLFETNK